jgi:hypothetical protein
VELSPSPVRALGSNEVDSIGRQMRFTERISPVVQDNSWHCLTPTSSYQSSKEVVLSLVITGKNIWTTPLRQIAKMWKTDSF